MSIDPRTPVLVGLAQSVDRTSEPGQGLSPQEMMAAVSRAAIADSGCVHTPLAIRRTSCAPIISGPMILKGS